MKKPKLFISHAWTYNHQYYKLVQMLNERPYFDFHNYSVPEHDPLDFDRVEELEFQLKEEIVDSDIVLVLGGMYAAHRKWIKREIEIAIEEDKPIIAVLPRGQINSPRIVIENADEVVRWNRESIIRAIRNNI